MHDMTLEQNRRSMWKQQSEKATQQALSVLRAGHVENAMQMLESIEYENELVNRAHHHFILQRQPRSMDERDLSKAEIPPCSSSSRKRRVTFSSVLETTCEIQADDETDRDADQSDSERDARAIDDV